MQQLSEVDLVLTDPPFFMPATHYQSRVGWQRTWGDTSVLSVFWREVTKSYLATMKNTAHAIIFCNHESYPVFYPVMYSNFHYLKSIVWDKTHFGLGRIWRNQHELIIAARFEGSIYNDDGKPRADVLSYRATPTSQRTHPVEKPVSLLNELIVPTTVPGALVLDPFMGSGTTLIAARRNGRLAIGIEIEEKYCEIAAKIMEEQKQIPFPQEDNVPGWKKQLSFF